MCDTRCGGIVGLHELHATYAALGTAPNGHDGDSGYNESDLCARAHQVCRGTHRESNHSVVSNSAMSRRFSLSVARWPTEVGVSPRWFRSSRGLLLLLITSALQPALAQLSRNHRRVGWALVLDGLWFGSGKHYTSSSNHSSLNFLIEIAFQKSHHN